LKNKICPLGGVTNPQGGSTNRSNKKEGISVKKRIRKVRR